MTTPSDIDSVPALSASVQVLPLAPGLYMFSVKAAASNALAGDGQLRVPAMHVGLGPGVNPEQVDFLAGPATHGGWLFAKDDLLVTKVGVAGATLIMTSVRGPGGEALTIKVERLDVRADEAALPSAVPAPRAAVAAPTELRSGTIAAKRVAKPSLVVTAHIRSRGDMSFNNAPWAGRIAPGLWIESFSIRPLEGFAAEDIEYKGLTGSGFETPWLSNATMCGTKGLAVPLVGFAVRLRPGIPEASAYECEYSGYFKSGSLIGPLRNGAPCRSTTANDPLEGIQMRITPRTVPLSPTLTKMAAKNETPTTAVKGPYFGRYRAETEIKDRNGTPDAKAARQRLDPYDDGSAKGVAGAEPRQKQVAVANPMKRPVNS